MTKEDIIRKLTSRKFWLALAAGLASVATMVSGLNSGDETITTIGTVCAVASAAIYAAAEAYVDASRK